MSEHLAPIDESVKLPRSVVAAAAAAAEIHKQAYEQPANPESQPAQAAEPPAEQPANEPAAAEPVASPSPQPDPAPATPTPAEPDWKHRYHAMEGRVRQMSDINATLVQQVQNLSTAVTQLQRPPEPSKPLVSDEERKAYGDDLLSVVERTALQTVQPRLNQLQQENDQLRQRVQRDEGNTIRAILDARLPGWREVNTHPDFLQWLSLPDIYSGQVRGGMLRAAFASGDADRVLAFFAGFLNENPQYRGQTPQSTPAAPAPTRVAARDLKDLAAPGKARPATGNSQVPAEKPVFTNQQIDRFYERVRKGYYNGRVDQKNREEAEIFAAMAEGRIRRVK